MEQISTRGGTPGGHNPPGCARRPRHTLVGAALLGPPPVPIFWYISHFDLEEIRGGIWGRSTTVSRRNLGRSTFALRRSDSAEGTSLRRGKPSSSSSPTTLPTWGGQSPSTSSPAPSHLQTLIHLLYPILISKSGIGASRLLVVLITPCS